MESFKDVVNEKDPGLFSQCINTYSKENFSKFLCESKDTKSSFEIDTRNFLCRGCKLSMERGKMPKMCSNNSLKVDVLPEAMKRLTELENNMIA